MSLLLIVAVVIAAMVLLGISFLIYIAVRAFLAAHIQALELAVAVDAQDAKLRSLHSAVYRTSGRPKKKNSSKHRAQSATEEGGEELPFNQELADSLAPEERAQYMAMFNETNINNEDEEEE